MFVLGEIQILMLVLSNNFMVNSDIATNLRQLAST